MKPTSLVTVVMPIYNTERYLPDAIRSVVSQTYSNWELLLLNDGSPGKTSEMVATILDPRIRYLEHPNCGVAATRNRGMREGRGEYIAFLDSDDVWVPHKLEKQLEIFRRNPEVGVVFSQRETITETGEVCEGYKPRLYSGMILNYLWVNNFVSMSSAVIARRVITESGYFDESLRMSEDFEYWLRVACGTSFAFVDEPLVHYRTHAAQVSNQVDLRQEVVMQIRRRFEAEHPGALSLCARRVQKSVMLCNQATRKTGKSPMALADYLRSLYWYPLHGPSWRGILRLLLPKAFLDGYRKHRRTE